MSADKEDITLEAKIPGEDKDIHHHEKAHRDYSYVLLNEYRKFIKVQDEKYK